MKGRIWTVPNQITLLRLGFLPFFLILISYERFKWALLVLVVAGLSDGIDGLLARSLNQRSSLGAYLDPIADKLLLSSSFIILVFTVVFSAAYPDFHLRKIIHLLVYGVTFFSVFSALHYSFSTARHLSGSSST